MFGVTPGPGPGTQGRALLRVTPPGGEGVRHVAAPTGEAPVNALFFLPGPNGALACRHWQGELQRAPVLLLPPLHEEMNRSRVQLRRIGDHLRSQGHSVLLGDLSGTGDSDGEFGETSLSRWRADVAALCGHLQSSQGHMPVVVAVRGGALLIPRDCTHWIACFPLHHGRKQMQQWLRQRLYAGQFQGEDISREGLLAAWRSEGIEVAGYALSPALLAELDTAGLPLPARAGHRGHVIEWQQAQPSPAFGEAAASGSLHWRSLQGPAFWQTPDTTVIDDLPEAIAAWMPR